MTPGRTLVTPNTIEPDLLMGGFLNIDKPAGWTSHDVVAKIRKVLGIKRVGHLGTLDPQATGVLPICFGKGTKLSSLLCNDDKEYEAVLRLGQETETEDASGKITRSTPVPEALRQEVGLRKVVEILSSFIGDYMQQPPMYSAIKINGVPLYKRARDGQVIERPVRRVTIRKISSIGMHGNDVAFRVACSKGTYIRTLCADIGTRLGVGGHLLSLRRTRSGCFLLSDALELDLFINQFKEGSWTESIYPLHTVLSGLPTLSVKEEYTLKLMQGVQIGLEGLTQWEAFKTGDSLRLLGPEGILLAIGIALRDLDTANGEEVGFRSDFYKIKTVLRDAGAPIQKGRL